MAERFISGRAALSKFIFDLRDDMVRRMAENGHNASGKTAQSIAGNVVDGLAISGIITANDNWRFVGNGRGPGKPPPVERLKEWAIAKGIATESDALSFAYGLSKSIAKHGTLDFQLGGKNLFEEAVLDDQEARIEAVLEAFGNDFEEITISQFNDAFAA